MEREIRIKSAMKRDQVGLPPKGRPELFLSRARRSGFVPRWMPVVVAAFVCAFLMSPDEAWAFSEAGTGLQSNATNPEKVELVTPVTVATGGTSANLSATGGANQFVKQSSPGGPFSVGTIADADVPDTISATNYCKLTGGADCTMTGQLSADNLGIEFEESDTNPTCAAGNFNVFADLSENKLKKCQNGTASDLDTGGADTVIRGKMAIASSVKFSMGASATKYMALNGKICTTEGDCLIPFEAGTFDNLTCLSSATQTLNNVTVTLGLGPCSGTITYDGATLDIPATALTSATATGAKSAATGTCPVLKITTGVGEALANSYVNCSLTVPGPAV